MKKMKKTEPEQALYKRLETVAPAASRPSGQQARVASHLKRSAKTIMTPVIKWNDAWESVPPEYADDIAMHIKSDLQQSHPLRQVEFIPVAKLWRKWKYLLEDVSDSEALWLLDMDKKKRFKGKTCYWFKKMESQEELDEILRNDLQWWIQYMKDAGAWNE